MEDFKYYKNMIKEEIKLAFAHNKYFLIGSALIFIIPMFVGYFYSDQIAPYIQPMVDTFEENIRNGTVTLSTKSLFANNVEVAIILYALSALGAILGIVVLANNGLFIGFYGANFELTRYVLLTLPHGIFEISAIIIATTGGFVILSFVLNFLYNVIYPDYSYTDIFDPYFSDAKITVGQRFKSSFKKHGHRIKESFILLCIAVILLIIAAFIEANITIPLAYWICSLLGISLI